MWVPFVFESNNKSNNLIINCSLVYLTGEVGRIENSNTNSWKQTVFYFDETSSSNILVKPPTIRMQFGAIIYLWG